MPGLFHARALFHPRASRRAGRHRLAAAAPPAAIDVARVR
jgi:hypothetical protein